MVDYLLFALCAPVAQLDRASASGAEGHRFESCRARQFPSFQANAQDLAEAVRGGRTIRSAAKAGRARLGLHPARGRRAGADGSPPGHKREHVETIAVTDFYDLRKIAARTAFYVIGSDVVGPMGHELVPWATRADAEVFLTEHFGARVLRFDDVTQDVIGRLDAKGP